MRHVGGSPRLGVKLHSANSIRALSFNSATTITVTVIIETFEHLTISLLSALEGRSTQRAARAVNNARKHRTSSKWTINLVI